MTAERVVLALTKSSDKNIPLKFNHLKNNIELTPKNSTDTN
jgi:hypothetical protein